MPRNIVDENNPNQVFVVADDVTDDEAISAIKPYLTPPEMNPKIQALMQAGSIIGNLANQYAQPSRAVPSPAGAIAAGRFMNDLMNDLEALNREQALEAKRAELEGKYLTSQPPKSTEDLLALQQAKYEADRKFLQDIAKKRLDMYMMKLDHENRLNLLNQEYSLKNSYQSNLFEQERMLKELEHNIRTKLENLKTANEVKLEELRREYERQKSENATNRIFAEGLIRLLTSIINDRNSLQQLPKLLNSQNPDALQNAGNLDIPEAIKNLGKIITNNEEGEEEGEKIGEPE